MAMNGSRGIIIQWRGCKPRQPEEAELAEVEAGESFLRIWE
jgi:hypothetical protein